MSLRLLGVPMHTVSRQLLTRTIRRGGRMRPRAPAPPRPEIMLFRSSVRRCKNAAFGEAPVRVYGVTRRYSGGGVGCLVSRSAPRGGVCG